MKGTTQTCNVHRDIRVDMRKPSLHILGRETVGGEETQTVREESKLQRYIPHGLLRCDGLYLFIYLFIYSLFNDAFSISGYSIALNDRMMMDNELETTQKETVVFLI
jgi:hypothetical protein